MADYVTITRSRGIFFGYCCSRCSNPNVMPAAVRSTIRQRQRLAGNISAEQCAESQIDALIRKIEDDARCLDSYKDLGNFSPGNQIDDFTKASTVVKSNQCFCPICGCIEPWMDMFGFTNTHRLDHNYIRLFRSRERAVLWAKLKLQEQLEGIETHRTNEKAVEEAWKLYIANTSRIEEITNELKMPDKRQRLQSLLLEYKQLEQKMKTSKVFDFKARNVLSLQIEEKKRELTKLHTEIIQTEMVFQKEKSEKEQELAAVSLLINGADGSCEEYISTRSEAFRLRTV